MPCQTFTRRADNQCYNWVCDFLYYGGFVQPELYKLVADQHVHSSVMGDTGGSEVMIMLPRFQKFALVFSVGVVIDLTINGKPVKLTFGDESVEVDAADFDDAMDHFYRAARRVTDEQLEAANAAFVH